MVVLYQHRLAALTCDCFWPFSVRGSRRRRLAILYLGLFRHLQSVVSARIETGLADAAAYDTRILSRGEMWGRHGALRRVWTPGSMDDTRTAIEMSPNVSRMTTMEPRELVRNWVSAFNRADSAAMAAFYAKDAINHQVIWKPLVGRDAIQEMFEREFRRATMVCQIENIFQDGDWAILEWSDPKGLRGCGFFKVIDDQIVFQRGYFDELSFLRQQGLPLPAE